MKALNQLIRLRKFQVLEKQKMLAGLQAEMSKAKAHLDDVNAQALIEEAKAEQTEIGLFDFQTWLARVDRQRHLIREQMAELQVQVAAAQEALAAAYQDLKKIELVRDTQRDEERRAEQAAEQALLDEVALGIDRD